MHKTLPLLFLCLAIGATPVSAQVAIRSAHLRVAAFDMNPSIPRCGAALASPHVLRDPAPALAGADWLMFAQGGILDQFTCSQLDLMSPGRFGDRIWVSPRSNQGSWDVPVAILDRTSFPWMSDETYLRQHPETFVGHLASPSVTKVGSRYYMVFAATLNDQNLCAGEHFVENPCGSCFDPWSYFVVLWAVSDDGVAWRVRTGPPERIRINRAIDSALLWSLPHRWDLETHSGFKGVTRVSMVTKEEPDGLYFYVGAGIWGSWRTKNAVTRIKYDPSSEWGISTEPEVWDSNAFAWQRCPHGELPGWVNDRFARGDVFEGTFSSLGTTRFAGERRYVAVLSSSSLVPRSKDAHGQTNQISVRFSDDLIHWTPETVVPSRVPFVADGGGYDASVLDPFYIEDEAGVYHFFYASADGDDSTAADGLHDCGVSSTPDFPTAPYIGVGIYEGLGWNSRERAIRRH